MSDDLERLISKAQESLWDPEYVEQMRDKMHGIRRDTFDEIQWKYTIDQLEALRGQVDHLAKDFETSPPAYEDLFNLLMQGDPRPTDDEQVIGKYVPQAHMMRAMGESVEFDMLRRETRYNEYNSALAMLTMRDKMRKAFEELQEVMDAIAAAQEALAQAYQEALEAAASGDGAEGAADALNEALEGMQGAAGDSQDAADTAAGLMRGASRDAKSEIEQDQDTASAYGLAPGRLKRMSFEERRALTKRLNEDKLGEVADLIGQFRRSADTERRRTLVPSIDEIVDYKLGNDLNRLAQSELINLAVPELEDLFLLRYLRHELVVTETRAVDHADRGPIVLVCDESGSMEWPLNNHSREAWSKAVALALRDHAARQKRDFIYIGFGGIGQVWMKVFLKGESEVEDIVDFVTHFYAGGTEYQAPLRLAMEKVREYHSHGRARPDIVFITDGEFTVPSQFKTDWQEAREEVGVKCYGIQVGGKPTSDMRKIVDRVLQVDRLTADPAGVKDLFRTI